MATARSNCPICSSRILPSAGGLLKPGGLAHLKCAEVPDSINRWPEGIRDLLCLNCERAFQSASKIQRLCRACR